MADAAYPYEIDLVHLDGQAELRLAGEFDLANAPELRRRLLDRLTAAIPIVVDMGGVTYIDSSALGVFMEADKMAASRGTTFRLVNVSEAAVRVLEITGLYDHLTNAEPRADAK